MQVVELVQHELLTQVFDPVQQEFEIQAPPTMWPPLVHKQPPLGPVESTPVLHVPHEQHALLTQVFDPVQQEDP